jgi:hypothetical protein
MQIAPEVNLLAAKIRGMIHLQDILWIIPELAPSSGEGRSATRHFFWEGEEKGDK